MSAIAGIKSELRTRREEREEASGALNATHKKFMKARTAFELDQKRVEFLNGRIEPLAKALRDLGGTDG